MKKIFTVFSIMFFAFGLTITMQAQELDQQIIAVEDQILDLEKQQDALRAQLEELKLQKLNSDLKEIGFPSDIYIEHKAMVLEYSEPHEQARWVMHMITPDIEDGVVFRTNDFRPDSLVLTGTAVQIDYFLTDTLASGEVKYDGFGYDRGHLAPSADFRWSAQALSESYLYSNMSPQVPDLNRKGWATLEDHLRKYVIDKQVSLYVITAPVLTDDLAKIERSSNGVSIPQQYVKFVLDKVNGRSIAFIVENAEMTYPIENYAFTVDEAEEVVGFDVFPASLVPENELDKKDWFEELSTGDVEPLKQNELPRNHFNTVVAGKRIGKKTTVCGKVVSNRISRSGNLWLNIDKQFPGQIFSVFIKKEDFANFPFELQTHLKNKEFCFSGKVEDLNGTPTMNIKRNANINLLAK